MRMIVFVLVLFIPAFLYCDEKNMTEQLKTAKEKHAAAILALPDAVSVGIGKGSDGNPAIIVGLAQPNSRTEEKVLQALKGYPIEIRVTGRIKTQSP